ncbi:Odorant receptor 47b [Lucilia cuprina]|uniref:Odorant receptor n=1 Tax=Lucilia cuprina TaxID=7375 RepID=A0A0L0BPD7_LUCCU|nr:Odorant receptor 47b [Lucilia cuprina]
MKKVAIKKFTKHQEITEEEEEEYGLEEASLKSILVHLKDLRKVLRHKQEPGKISLVYMRNYMRLMFIFPRTWKGESLLYRVINKFLMIMLIIFTVSITFDLYEASQDVLQFGEDLVVLIGIYLIFFKLILTAYYAQDIEYIICEFAKMHKYFSQLKRSPKISHKIPAICLPPILTPNTTPYRAKYPFEWQSSDEHPIRFALVYIFQSLMTLFVLLSILVIDNIGCHIFTQTTLNLKIFCILIRDMITQPADIALEELHKVIQFHQYIISLISKINVVYYYNYTAQMAASTFMICLTAFEAMLAQDQPMLAIKFQIYMFSAFSQLFYWCATGNMVYYDSLDVADAAYEIDGWYNQSKEFKYYLRFLIQRAQTPLVFQPKPLFGFNFETFSSILSTSYSYFALLRTMND